MAVSLTDISGNLLAMDCVLTLGHILQLNIIFKSGSMMGSKSWAHQR